MHRPQRVGVVGLGVAGAATAFLLARDGHQVTLLERAPQMRAIGAGILLQKSGQEVLRHLGILDDVIAHAAPLEELHARHDTGQTLIRTRFPDFEPGCLSYGVHRGMLFNALRSLLMTTPAEVRLACDIVSRDVTPTGEVWLGDAGGHRHGPFDFTIAADGARSRMRDACGMRASITKYTHGTLWIIAPGPGVPGKLLQVVRGNRFLFGLLPLGDGLVTLYWGLPLDQYDAMKRRGLDALKAEILAFSPEAGPVLDMVVDFSQLLLTSYQHVHMPRWYDHHTLFLGDACHAMSPHLGQGINLALLDAWRFAAAMRQSLTPQLAFSRYWRERRIMVRYYATVTWLLSPFFQSDWPILGWGRDLALPLFPWLPGVYRQMLMTVAGVKGGWLRGRIQV